MTIADFTRAARLTMSLAWYDILTQRKESFLGLVWPMLQAGGLLLAFNLFRGGTGGIEIILSTYLGVLVWTTASTVLISNLRILHANRELITHIVFSHPILSVVDVSVKYLFFVVQILVGVAAWLVLTHNDHWPLVLAYLPIYLLAFYLALLAMAWMASIVGAALPDLSFLLPPTLLLLLALSPVFQRTAESVPWAVRIFNEINPLSLWVDAFYATIDVTRTGPTAPLAFLTAALVAVVLARFLVTICYREITKVI
jgi:ABC-type polysaccharide/polyol phosphate export permease